MIFQALPLTKCRQLATTPNKNFPIKQNAIRIMLFKAGIFQIDKKFPRRSNFDSAQQSKDGNMKETKILQKAFKTLTIHPR